MNLHSRSYLTAPSPGRSLSGSRRGNDSTTNNENVNKITQQLEIINQLNHRISEIEEETKLQQERYENEIIQLTNTIKEKELEITDLLENNDNQENEMKLMEERHEEQISYLLSHFEGLGIDVVQIRKLSEEAVKRDSNSRRVVCSLDGEQIGLDEFGEDLRDRLSKNRNLMNELYDSLDTSNQMPFPASSYGDLSFEDVDVKEMLERVDNLLAIGRSVNSKDVSDDTDLDDTDNNNNNLLSDDIPPVNVDDVEEKGESDDINLLTNAVSALNLSGDESVGDMADDMLI